ncbi:MAG TPA: peptidoglycan-binding protein [Bacillales bacterium]|nr:peptidoglycan-binding protein [Bacillales bacterium]
MPLPILRNGSTGRYVTRLERNLNGLALNYNGFVVDRRFDGRTRDAVRNFQDRFRLAPDGIVGPITWRVLLDNVRAVQSLLRSRGFSPGPVDGWYGPMTRSAVLRFQAANGLRQTGIVDPRTRQRLFNPRETGHYERRPSSSDIASLHPTVAAQARRFLRLTRENGLNVRIANAFRSWNEQDRLYARGRTEPGRIVTNAMGGDSFHNWGLAFDAYPIVNGRVSNDLNLYRRMGRLGQQAGLEWGGTFRSIKDFPHFQNTFRLNTWDLLNGVRPR